MAHKEQMDFCTTIRDRFKDKFTNVSVLDCGSLDINGNNRYLFEGYSYIGLDVGEGKNVDVVCLAGEYDAEDESFDVIVSTEMLEHDMHYGDSLRNMVRMLKPDGMFLITCATTGRAEHGTRNSNPQDAPLLEGGWSDYYKNLTENDIRSEIDVDEIFKEYEFAICRGIDLYFWGIKR